jgi:hypothetical protein
LSSELFDTRNQPLDEEPMEDEFRFADELGPLKLRA